MSPQFFYDFAFQIEIGTCTSFAVSCFIGVQLPKFKQSFSKNRILTIYGNVKNFTNVVTVVFFYRNFL